MALDDFDPPRTYTVSCSLCHGFFHYKTGTMNESGVMTEDEARKKIQHYPDCPRSQIAKLEETIAKLTAKVERLNRQIRKWRNGD